MIYKKIERNKMLGNCRYYHHLRIWMARSSDGKYLRMPPVHWHHHPGNWTKKPLIKKKGQKSEKVKKEMKVKIAFLSARKKL